VFQSSAEASVNDTADSIMTTQSMRGKSINEAVSQLTGTAVNPLFGITALGMYKYFGTPEHLREQLPFHDQPCVWGPMLLIILLMLFNSTICESMPFFKIPLNALGDMVNKGGACVVLPAVLYEFSQAFAAPTAVALAAIHDGIFPTAYAAGEAGGIIAGGWLTIGWAVSFVLGAIGYATVWVVWNVIDVAIFILPVPFLDAILKSLRHTAMGLLFGASWLHPWLGLVMSLAMLCICWRLTGWAFRLSVMGFVFSTDFLLWRKSGVLDATAGISAFVTGTASKRWKIHKRQYGRLRRKADGALHFVCRSWIIVGLERKIDLGSPRDYLAGSTLLYPVILDDRGDQVLFRLPPRYRRDTQAITDLLGLYACRDVSIIRNIWKMLRGVGFKSRAIP